MHVSNYINVKNYVSFNDWKEIWDTRGFVPKNVRTDETEKNNHRATSKPIMTGERLTYDEKKGCFSLHWYVLARNALTEQNLAFECYPNGVWRLYPMKSSNAGWDTRGVIARINKYCPLHAYMYTSKGAVVCKGLGHIGPEGVVITETSQTQRMYDTRQTAAESIHCALNLGTYGNIEGSRSSRAVPYRHASDLNYTREKLCNILDGYTTAYMEELLVKSVFTALMSGHCCKGSDVEDLARKYWGGPPSDVDGGHEVGDYFKYPITNRCPEKFLFLNQAYTSDNLSLDYYPIIGMFGLYEKTIQENIKYCFYNALTPYYRDHLRETTARYPFNVFFEVADHRQVTTAPNAFVRHMLSFFYARNITKVENLVGAHLGLVCLCVVIYAAKSLSKFRSMVELLLGKEAYSHIRGNLSIADVESYAQYLSGDHQPILKEKRPNSNKLSKFIERIFWESTTVSISKHMCSDGYTLKGLMKKFDPYKQIMKEVLTPLVDIGVNYNKFGLSPYMSHVEISEDLEESPFELPSIATRNTNTYTNDVSSAHANDRSCTTSLVSMDAILESNPLGLVSNEALVISEKSKENIGFKGFAKDILNIAYADADIEIVS